MKGLLILNGEKSDALPKVEDYKYVFVTDGAYEKAKKELPKIDLVVGDFDSLCYTPNEVAILPLEKEKDFTDGEVAIETLIKNGCDEIDIYWALGDRFDHTLGNLSLLKIAKDENVTAKIKSKNGEVNLLSGKILLKNLKNKTISILPFTDSAHILNGEGLKYSVDNLTIKKNMTIGISNVAVEDMVKLEVDIGEVLIIIND